MPAQVADRADSKMEDVPPANAATDGLDQDHSDGKGGSEGSPDPDAQTTVTDFLDFTEYLPSDIMRSLTLIGNLDQNYADASNRVHDLTTKWGQLPTLASSERPSPVQLRADISEQLNQAVSSRVFAHAEAMRMSENVGRHYNKAKFLLSKLQAMMDIYPTEEEQQKSPVGSRSPTATRKTGTKADGDGPQRRKPRIPKITVPGEVLAPYDIEYDTFSDGSDVSSDEDDIIPASRRTPAATPRIKLITSNKPPKSASRRPPPQTPAPSAEELAAHHAALLRPPPPDAVIGSSDAPWLQLTEYELAKLRKRMKKNATWTPSETMVARELRLLGRGPEDYREAKKKAEEEGETFDPTIPAPVAEDSSGAQQFPTGAISADSVAAEEVPTSNRGMKLNEAKKLKREAQMKMAADEADESNRKSSETAKFLLGNTAGTSASPSDDAKSTHSKFNARANSKRKRGQDSDAGSEAVEADDTPSARQQAKRTKTETPVPPPQLGRFAQNNIQKSEASGSRHSTSGGGPRTQTPVPVPVPRHSTRAAASTAPNTPTINGQTVTTSVPTKPPGTETPVPLPRTDRRKSTTPVVPPTRELPKREARGDANRTNTQPEATEPNQQAQPTVEPPSRRSSSRGPNPAKANPAPESSGTRRPGSRGKALSQEPQFAHERPRRASTARNTPMPETRPPSRRAKRPAPGVVSTTSSGGSAAVGKRKAAPRKKARAKREDQSAEVEMEEVDDEGNPIDPDEPRYCLCNRVSFGTMISCDNVDNCRLEWFHLECVGLDNIPARTTKWYCPDCRKALGLGEKGEVSARGVKK